MSYEFITEQGVIVADTSDILEEIESEYKTAFNNENLVTTPDTPQGALIVSETIARTGVQSNNANIANQINPEIAGGIFLDAIAALTNIKRLDATATIVTATLTGVEGTIISAGSIAKSGENEFEIINDVTIPVGGSIDGNFQSVELGAIPCPPSSLTVIVTDILGWETINNTDAGIVGIAEQNDAVFKRFRKETISNQGVALPLSIRSNIRLVEGVNSLSFLENIANTTEVIENISLKPHSIFLCIDGGSDEDIAFSLYDTKTLGADYNGSTSITIQPEDSDADYTVLFERPSLIQINIKISVKVATAGGDPVAIVREAVLNYANGLTEEAGFAVGANVSAFELSASISVQTDFFVTIVETSIDGINFDSLIKTIELDEKAFTTESLIQVTVL